MAHSLTSRISLILITTALVSVTASCSKEGGLFGGRTIDWATDVKPIIENNCLPCHNTYTLLGHINLESRALAFEPGPDGPFIIPGRPSKSIAYQLIMLEEGKRAMPPVPKKHRLTKEEKETLRLWILQGAEWPEGPEGHLTKFIDSIPQDW